MLYMNMFIYGVFYEHNAGCVHTGVPTCILLASCMSACIPHAASA